MIAALRRSARGPRADDWVPPAWLLPHQVEAARRIAGSLEAFGGALLADAVGLGKTFVALAIATRLRSVCAVVPASLVEQWTRAAGRVGTPVGLRTHEALSRGARVPAAELVVVDEAHRFRNPATRRYDTLARDVAGRPLLLLTATPVVNRGTDLIHLLRLFLPDDGLACFGVPSLDRAGKDPAGAGLLRAASPVVVARSAEVALPAPGALPDIAPRTTISAAPAQPEAFRRLLDALASLRFPAAGSPTGAGLLRLHLYARFASSITALRETLYRHAAFLERAGKAVEQGRIPSRSLYRALFGPGDDMQLHFDLLLPAPSNGVRPDPADLDAEAERVRNAVTLTVEAGRSPAPKVQQLQEVLRRRESHKTIVFTSAVATATTLARCLGWRQVAVVGGGRAWIASGRVGLEEALRLFAPTVRGAPPPAPGRRLMTLVTTDLLSEGIDLQDANGVVHYDLPWTPLRLAQRIGRAARLGTRHSSVAVWWFVPPPELETRLRILTRLERKAEDQLRLAVPVSSGVGRAVRVNRQLAARERLAPIAGAEDAVRRLRHRGGLVAVVQGPSVAVCALRWRLHRAVVPELVAVGATPCGVIDDLERIAALLEQLGRAPTSSHAVPTPLRNALVRLMQARLRDALAGPGDPATLRLRRLLLRRARQAGRARDGASLAALDLALDRLHAGLPAGGTAELAALLERGPTPDALRDWGIRHPVRRQHEVTVRVEALLCGDGSRPS